MPLCMPGGNHLRKREQKFIMCSLTLNETFTNIKHQLRTFKQTSISYKKTNYTCTNVRQLYNLLVL